MTPSRPRPPGRLLGTYALSVMAREGPIHGYQLSQRISERTEGSWRPGAGAIYPALVRLVERGFASGRAEGARRLYSITPKGRAFLRQFTDRRSGRPGSVPDTTVLWMEIVGESDRGRYLLRHLRRHLDQAARYAESIAGSPVEAGFRRGVQAEFVRFKATRRAPPKEAVRSRGGRARRTGR